MVAVSAPGLPGALRRRLVPRGARPRPGVAAGAGAAGAVLRAAWTGILAVRALAGLLLMAYGAWTAWQPAGALVVGAGLLADRVAEQRAAAAGDERPGGPE